MTLNWTIFLFIALAILLLVMIFLFARLNSRNNQYYNTIHSDLMNLVPLKIDLAHEMITFFSRLEVLNNKKRTSIFVFKSMINRKARVELEILFQNLLVNQVPFTPVNYLIYFQLHNKIIIYDLTLDYYDQENKILYGQMQSNTRYNRFVISERIDVNPAQLTVPKADFIATILSFLKTAKHEDKAKNLYEYMILIKIRNYNNLESILTINNIQSMELLLTYCAKNLLGPTSTLICKYYDGEFLVYTRNKKINLAKFQKHLNSYIKNNLVEKSSYLQIQTQILVVYSWIKTKGSNVSNLYNKIIDVNLLNNNVDKDLLEIRLRTSENQTKINNHYELIHSQEIKKLLEITISPVYKTDNAKEPDCYYARLGLIDNAYYGNYINLIRNIQDAGLWWKVYEPMFLQVLQDFAQLKVKKSLIVPFLLMELENKTVLTQIINIIKKRQNLFKDANLIFDFQDNCVTKINNWVKYENIISTLREHNVKIAFSHELKNINNFKLISHFKPDFVILTENLLKNVAFRFNRYIKLIICLNYLNILGVKKVMALGVDSVPEIIMLKSLNIKYLSGNIFESENVDKIIDSLNYPNYWSWKKSQNKKGHI